MGFFATLRKIFRGPDEFNVVGEPPHESPEWLWKNPHYAETWKEDDCDRIYDLQLETSNRSGDRRLQKSP